MCNCSPNSTCDCNDYRVTTGPQGNTGPAGPQGPAGPPGNASFLYSKAYVGSSPPPATTALGSYEVLETFTMNAGELGTNYDNLIIKATLGINSTNLLSKKVRLTLNSSPVGEFIVNTPNFLGFTEIKWEIARVTSNAVFISGVAAYGFPPLLNLLITRLNGVHICE